MMRLLRDILVAGFVAALSLSGAPPLHAQASRIAVVEISYMIDGRTLELSLAEFLELSPGLSFSTEEELSRFVASLQDKLRAERLFDTSSTVTYELDGSKAHLYVSVKDSINALAVPFPKYSGSEGASLAVRYKDFNFLGTMRPLSVSADYYFSARKLDLGAELEYAFDYAGARWDTSASLGLGLAVEAAPKLDAGFSASGVWPMPWLGLDWEAGPVVSYSYAGATDRHRSSLGAKLALYLDRSVAWSVDLMPAYSFSVRDGAAVHSVSAALGTAAAIPVWTAPSASRVTLSPSASISFSEFFGSSPADLALKLAPSLAYADLKLAGNQRHGVTFSAGADYAYHMLRGSEKAHDLKLSADLSAFAAFSPLVGLNARFVGRWFVDRTYWGRANSFDWWALVRGKSGSKISDVGAVVNLELPINFAQGLFFDSPTFEAEVHLNAFIDAGFVRADGAADFFGLESRVLCAGVDAIVYPAKARAFTYRLSVGVDLLSARAKGSIGSEDLEIWLGLGLHF